MNPHDKLARMANQIATFFRSYPEEDAIKGVHDHIVSFWPARMRADLDAAIDADAALDHDARTLDPFVVAAFRRNTRGASPVLREAAGPETVGSLGSDAG